ncbi:MAG: Crp/Fnr family transcriptional regulator [Spirochaetota bacterium]|nr:Crp/Fnr family transcriptional regulator [Spirochaetota bacterium]
MKKTEFFRDISLSARGEIAKQGSIISISRNEILFLEEDVGSTFYILAEGSVKLYKAAPDGREITIRLVKPNEVFAETILFENNCYPVSAVAVTDASLFAIQRFSFYVLLDQSDFRNEFIAILMKRMRYLTNRILYLTSYDVEERFFMFLVDRYGKKDSYDIKLSKKDIASVIGTIPETFSRLILRLKKRGVLEWEGSTLNILNSYWEDLYLGE